MTGHSEDDMQHDVKLTRAQRKIIDSLCDRFDWSNSAVVTDGRKYALRYDDAQGMPQMSPAMTKAPFWAYVEGLADAPVPEHSTGPSLAEVDCEDLVEEVRSRVGRADMADHLDDLVRYAFEANDVFDLYSDEFERAIEERADIETQGLDIDALLRLAARLASGDQTAAADLSHILATDAGIYHKYLV